MARIKQIIRKVSKAKEISINIKGKSGLSRGQINEVLGVIREARNKDKLPAMSYEYNPHTLIFGKDPLYLKPKTASLSRTGVQVRRIIREHFGNKYTVQLV